MDLTNIPHVRPLEVIVSRPADLPEFERPPVSEVILGIQFGTLPFKTLHAGLLAQRFPDLTEHSEQLPLGSNFEVFGGQNQLQLMPQFDFGQLVMIPRYWFRTPDKRQVVQVQNDHILRNWSRKDPDDVYPRYEQVRDDFSKDIQTVQGFFNENKIGEIKINQVEISYVNSIDLPDNTNPQNQLSRIFRMWSKDYHDDQGREEEDGNLNFRYVLHGDDGVVPVGRLYASIQPAIRLLQQDKVVQFTLTVRGKPVSESAEDALKFCDFGRNVIVRAFASMTREEMHVHWGRR